MQETFVQAVLLGMVQGVTEFAPVSSSGHLVVVPWLLAWPEPSVAFDVLLHLGSLLAVVVYFRKDLWRIVVGTLGVGDTAQVAVMRRLAGLLVLATVPGAVIGKLLSDFFESMFSAPLFVGMFFLVTAAILTAAERFSPAAAPGRATEDVRVADALAVGLAQAVAILPGVSRSGSTISTGMLMGLRRDEAARFSFLLSIPIILGAAVFKVGALGVLLEAPRSAVPGVAGFLAAAVSGYLCIHFLLPYLRRRPLKVFAAYCVAAGSLTIAVALSGLRG